MSNTISFTLDGEEIEAQTNETIWEIAKRRGNTIPHLCHRDKPGYRPDANCAPAWSKSTANVCWLPRAAARQRRA